MNDSSAGEERQRIARVAAVTGPLLSLVVPVTMPLVGFTAAETRSCTLLLVPIAIALGLAVWFAPWRGWADHALLAIPLAAWSGLALLGLAADGKADTYTGFTALLFLFIGLTQRPWTSVLLVPIALLTHLALYGGPSTELAARLPISLTVWVTTAEIVARYRMRSRGDFDALELRANLDPLTQLDNRHDLGRLLSRLRAQDAVLLIDIDRFKRLNDSAGHAAGDDVLRAFGAVVRDVVRAADHAIRYGGEEFLIVLTGAGVDGARRLDERLRTAWSERRPDVTFSAGIAVAGDLPRTVMDRADVALYEAKAAGRNRTVVSGAAPGAVSTWPERSAPDRIAT